jgi:hypothetical protein
MEASRVTFPFEGAKTMPLSWLSPHRVARVVVNYGASKTCTLVLTQKLAAGDEFVVATAAMSSEKTAQITPSELWMHSGDSLSLSSTVADAAVVTVDCVGGGNI